jgi:hypothetical protein
LARLAPSRLVHTEAHGVHRCPIWAGCPESLTPGGRRLASASSSVHHGFIVIKNGKALCPDQTRRLNTALWPTPCRVHMAPSTSSRAEVYNTEGDDSILRQHLVRQHVQESGSPSPNQEPRVRHSTFRPRKDRLRRAPGAANPKRKIVRQYFHVRVPINIVQRLQVHAPSASTTAPPRPPTCRSTCHDARSPRRMRSPTASRSRRSACAFSRLQSGYCNANSLLKSKFKITKIRRKGIKKNHVIYIFRLNSRHTSIIDVLCHLACHIREC